MTQRLCSRCHAVLPPGDEGSLLFCPHCGAPQIRLSAELREQAEQQRATAAQGSAGFIPPVDPTAIHWRNLMRYIALTSAIVAVLALVFPPLVLIAPPVALGIYASRHRRSRITAALGLRVGLLCGLFASTLIAVIFTAALVTARFGTHTMQPFDDKFQTLMPAKQAQVTAQSGPEAWAEMQRFFTVPEFRAGLMLATFGIILLVMVLLSAIMGAIAGIARRTPQTE